MTKIFDIFDKLNIKKGDILLVSSDIKSLMFYIARNKLKISLNDVIDYLKDKLGEEGTLLFPVYNWDFCKGIAFDYLKSPSKTGVLSQMALDRNDFKRTKHPIYSFAVWGKEKDYLSSLEYKDSFSTESIFHWLYLNSAKNLVIGLKNKGFFTFVHYVQQKMNVKYRYLKDFTAEYIDENLKSSERTYSMMVRDLDMQVENCTYLINDNLKAFGASQELEENIINLKLIDLQKAYKVIEDDINFNDSKNLAKFIGQK